VEFESQTAKARKSVHDIKVYQLKTQAKLTKQKILATEQLIEECSEKIKSQDIMIDVLDEERNLHKKKQTFTPDGPPLHDS